MTLGWARAEPAPAARRMKRSESFSWYSGLSDYKTKLKTKIRKFCQPATKILRPGRRFMVLSSLPVLPRFRPRFSLWPYFTLCSLLFPAACACCFRGLRTLLSTVGSLCALCSHVCTGSRVGGDRERCDGCMKRKFCGCRFRISEKMPIFVKFESNQNIDL